MQKRTTEFKLPQIKRPPGDKVTMSKTISSTTTTTSRVRPNSSNLVQDLQKKLFSQLDSYEGTGKKGTGKRVGKSSKQIESQCSTGTESTPEGYQKMQKFMPGLYSKLVEVKKGNFVPTQLSKLQNDPFSTQIQIRKKVPSKDSKGVQQLKKPVVKEQPIKEEKEDETYKEESEGVVMSREQMNAMFGEYLQKQGLVGEAEGDRVEGMEQLGASIVVCERQIEQIKRSMTDMIQHLSLQCLQLNEGFNDDD